MLLLPHRLTRAVATFCLLSSLPFSASCGGESAGKSTKPPDGAGNGGDSPAVMVSLLVPGVDASNFYVGVYPELPKTLETKNMLEVRSGFDARAFNGSIYVWEGEAGTYTRYTVDAQLQLHEDVTLSFRELGGTGTVMTSFVSPERAYSLTRAENEIIVWNPATMELIGSVSGAAIADPAYPDLDFGEASVFGDYVAWPVQWADYENDRFKPEVGVILVDTRSMKPAFVVSDARCGGGWMSYVDDAGDLYVTGNAIFGYAHFFGEQAKSFPRDCVVRIKSGSLSFDESYVRDLNRAAGADAVYHPWHVAGQTLLAAVLDPADDTSKLNRDDYWTTPMLRKLVMVDAESSRELEGIPKSAVWSTLGHRIDDTLYMLATEGQAFGGDGSPGSSRLYKVTAEGAELALSSKGFLWSIGRVR